MIEIREDEAGDIDLTNPECRHVVEKVLLESKAKVAVFDNLFAFARGNEKNTAEGWEGVLHWARTLAAKGYTVIFVAHTSRSGDLFGSITQKYLCRTILQLKTVKGQKSCFTLCGNKARGKPLNPDNLLIRIVDYGDKIKLEYEQSDEPNHDPYLIPVSKAIRDGCPTVTQLAELFEHNKSWASKRVRDYKKKGFIADGKPGIQPLTEQAVALLADAEVMNATVGDDINEAVL